MDMLSKRHLCADNLLVCVLDEADEMLSHGFKDQIYDIFKTLPANVQVCLLSASMALEILDFTIKFMRDVVRIMVDKDELTLEGIRQSYVAIESHDHDHDEYESSEDELEDVPSGFKRTDPYLHRLIKRDIDGTLFVGRIVDMQIVTSSREILYRVNYADGDYEYVTMYEVIDCLA